MAGGSYQTVSTVSLGEANSSVVTWNSSTAVNTTASIINQDYTCNTLNVSFSTTSTITAGQVTFQASLDGVNWFNVYGGILNTIIPVGPTYSLVASTYITFVFNMTALPYFQILLSTAITGTGALTIGYSADSFVGNLPTAPATISAPVNISTSGNNTIISGVAGQTIRVWKLFLECATASTSVQVTPYNAATAFCGPILLGSWVLDMDTEPWFVTSAGNAFILNLGSATQVSGVVYFTQS
jgi:hypothetical protein